MSDFKVGDIVENIKTGRVCNGKYGEVVEFENELHVQDNEGALEISLDYNPEDFKVVGHISTNPELLDIFVTR